eukprot:4524080-Prymnesium_polylepis.2
MLSSRVGVRALGVSSIQIPCDLRAPLRDCHRGRARHLTAAAAAWRRRRWCSRTSAATLGEPVWVLAVTRALLPCAVAPRLGARGGRGHGRGCGRWRGCGRGRRCGCGRGRRCGCRSGRGSRCRRRRRCRATTTRTDCECKRFGRSTIAARQAPVDDGRPGRGLLDDEPASVPPVSERVLEVRRVRAVGEAKRLRVFARRVGVGALRLAAVDVPCAL